MCNEMCNEMKCSSCCSSLSLAGSRAFTFWPTKTCCWCWVSCSRLNECNYLIVITKLSPTQPTQLGLAAGKIEISVAGLLKKLFNNNIVKLHFDEKKSVNAIESGEGEVVQLIKPVSTKTDQVETWLRELEHQVKATLRSQLFNALDAGKGTLQHPEWSLASQVRQ